MARRYGWLRRVAGATALTVTVGLAGLPVAAAAATGPETRLVTLVDWGRGSDGAEG